MFEFFAENLSTILVGAGVVALLTAIGAKLYRDKKKGKSSCGCHCANCPSHGTCHE